jgi:hypothetical protein
VGDPGVPVMTGLLAVPVGVFLFVLVLALLGGRWSVAVPDDDEPPPQPALEPVRPMLALPAAAPPQELLPYGYGTAEAPSRALEPWAPPRPRQPAPHYPYGRVRETEPPAEPQPEQRFPYGPYRYQ